MSSFFFIVKPPYILLNLLLLLLHVIIFVLSLVRANLLLPLISAVQLPRLRVLLHA